MTDLIVNKVADSGLVTIDLENYYPKEAIETFDLKPFLFMELILKEKPFRESLKQVDWQQYQDKYVSVICSADAVIPVWAYMLVAAYLQPRAKGIFLGNEEAFRKKIFIEKIRTIDTNEFLDKRVVIKGCGELPIEEYAYMEITAALIPVVKSIMYGEPCSTVPVFKKS